MRKLGLCVGALVIAAVMTNMSAAQSPQAAGSAATVLSNVQRYYASANQLTAAFRQTVTIATFGTSKSSGGQVWVVKPASFRFDYMEKQHGSVTVTKTLVFTGTTLWLIDHSNKQITQTHLQPGILPAAISFLTGTSAQWSQFTVAFNTSGTYGGNGDLVLELVPNQPSTQYKRLFFVVDPSNWRVKGSIVIDSNGNTNRFDFFTPNLASVIKASWFQVNPASFPTYKLVQLSQPGPAAGSASGSGSGSAVLPSR
jgi:outer membrane lipoprotein-sorting protein